MKQRTQVINDAIPGIILLFTGLGTLLDEGLTQNIMPYIDIIVGIVVVRLAIEELHSKHARKRFNWFDVSAGCVILIEAVNQYKPYKGFQPAYFYFLVGILTILRGIFAGKLPTFRKVTLNDEGIFVRTALLRSFSFSWSDLFRIDRSASALVFHSTGRARTLNLRRIENKNELLETIIGAAGERGIQVEIIK